MAMKRQSVIFLLIVFASLSATGCAGRPRTPLAPPQDMSLSEKADQENHGELERELSLYSD